MSCVKNFEDSFLRACEFMKKVLMMFDSALTSPFFS